MSRDTLKNEICSLIKDDILPMHMPGHKRRIAPVDGLPYDWDITEIKGADNLHDADGILREAMNRTAALFHSSRTFYLVGGSTVGILSAIRAAAPHGSEIIAARNCHKSVYHAIELGGYTVHWIVPPLLEEAEVFAGVDVRAIDDSIRKYPASRAVILTSPTYEGVLSDVRGIASMCHDAGIPLIVDEAHGPHLGLFDETGFPQGAVKCGADLVIQSAHKLLPSLTQTALLHVNSALVPEDEVERQLNIFETSSPSYLLLASLDGCTSELIERGESLFSQWREALAGFYARMRNLRELQILYSAYADRLPCKVIHDLDPGKILLYTNHAVADGEELADILRKTYRIEPEMSCGRMVLLMTSCADTDAQLSRLADALLELDQHLCQRVSGGTCADVSEYSQTDPQIETCISIESAASLQGEEKVLAQAAGRVSVEYVYAYPPGVPIIAPGERITQAVIARIVSLEETGIELFHSRARSRGTIACIRPE